MNMPPGRLWWMVKEERKVFIYVNNPQKKGKHDVGSRLRQHTKGRQPNEVGHITSLVALESPVPARGSSQQRQQIERTDSIMVSGLIM